MIQAERPHCTITTPGSGDEKGGVTIAVPPGTIITGDGKVNFPKSSGGGTVTHGSGHSFKIGEDAIIVLDDEAPLGYYIALDIPFTDIDKDA